MDIKDYIMKSLGGHPQDIVNLAMRKFGVSRVAVHKHLKSLIQSGKVSAVGKTRSRRYSLRGASLKFQVPVTPDLKEEALWNQHIQSAALKLPKNIYDICEYGFTEMVNNVIDHSQANCMEVSCNFSDNNLEMTISDNGIGIFRKIKTALHLETDREAILHLSKGKLTTDPEHHSGEGIFFTSRMFDVFHIRANGLQYSHFKDGDWLVDTVASQRGTQITLNIEKMSSIVAGEIFQRFSDPEKEYTFSKTEVVVSLGLLPGETYVSRSQAKRILFGLEKFSRITLDFKKVSTVGQGFVDEVFRVFQNKFPNVRIAYINANENVTFMIQRSLSRTPQPR